MSDIKYCDHCKFCDIDNYQRLTSWDEWESDGEVKKLKCKVSGEVLGVMIPRHNKTKMPSDCVFYDDNKDD